MQEENKTKTQLHYLRNIFIKKGSIKEEIITQKEFQKRWERFQKLKRIKELLNPFEKGSSEGIKIKAQVEEDYEKALNKFLRSKPSIGAGSDLIAVYFQVDFKYSLRVSLLENYFPHLENGQIIEVQESQFNKIKEIVDNSTYGSNPIDIEASSLEIRNFLFLERGMIT